MRIVKPPTTNGKPADAAAAELLLRAIENGDIDRAVAMAAALARVNRKRFRPFLPLRHRRAVDAN
jgi:hypothetical protein